MLEPPATIPPPRRFTPRTIFSFGLLVRLIGLLLIWAGDGHTGVFSKIVVVIGVVLSIGGIGVLKWLAMQPRRKRLPAPTLPDPTLPPV